MKKNSLMQSMDLTLNQEIKDGKKLIIKYYLTFLYSVFIYHTNYTKIK